jgi:hypothetical protein
MAAPTVPIPEIRHLLHTLREPLGAFAINIELLEGDQLTTAGQSYVKAMRGHMDRTRAALEEIAFILENGHKPRSDMKRADD